MNDAITFRPIRSEDEAFLRAVYNSTRAEELSILNWSESEKEAFLRMQFEAQRRHYETHFPKADFLLILRSGIPIGRFYLARLSDEFRIVDIALLPEHRDRGIGRSILENVLAEAAAAGQPVRIHVERSNHARRLYERLGFSVVDESPIYLQLERRPSRPVPRNKQA